jgi:hypothetical protein
MKDKRVSVSNLLKPSTNIMYHQAFNNKNYTFCTRGAFMCFVCISEQTATFALHNINRLDFITERKSVYCAVQTGSLNKRDYVPPLKGSLPRHRNVWWNGGVTTSIFNLGTTWKWVFSFTLRRLFPRGNSTLGTLLRRLGIPQNRPEGSAEEKHLFPLYGIEIRFVSRATRNFVANPCYLMK